MPVIAQAAKKLRRDHKAQRINFGHRARVREAVKSMRSKPTPKQLSSVFQTLDKAVKLHIIHANKAARLKSRLSKLLTKK